VTSPLERDEIRVREREVADGRRDKRPKAVTGAQGTIKTRNKSDRIGKQQLCRRKEVSKRNRIRIRRKKGSQGV
jgi:hypothetical protein